MSVQSTGSGQSRVSGARPGTRADLSAQDAQSAPHSGVSSLTVLVVDDHADAAEGVGALLAAMGHRVRVAYDARQAIEIFRTFRPQAVFMDLDMPGITGLEAAARIRLMPGGTASTIIALTGWGSDVHRQLSRDASIDYHVVKPATVEKLQGILRRVRAA